MAEKSTKLKVDRFFKKPEWQRGESAALYWDRIGAKNAIVTGGIGRSGEKVHQLWIHYLDTNNGIGLLNVMSTCGSGKWGSMDIPYFDTDLSAVNCKKCLR